VSGAQGRVGITDYAQKQLGDVVYIELPDVGRTVSQGEALGTIESVKAVSEIFAPVSGEVVEVNAALKDSPETVNSDPHGAWMVEIRLADPAETAALLDNTQYADLVKTE
jgi:glycine cleavage system H protein